jgi:hypothetical protein
MVVVGLAAVAYGGADMFGGGLIAVIGLGLVAVGAWPRQRRPAPGP